MTGEMTIENVINRSCINLHMKGRDKKEVIEEMAEMFDRAGVLVDKAGYIKAVYERESEGPTGIGDQVAIPHGKTAAVGKTAMAVGRLDKGIEWETLGERNQYSARIIHDKALEWIDRQDSKHPVVGFLDRKSGV